MENRLVWYYMRHSSPHNTNCSLPVDHKKKHCLTTAVLRAFSPELTLALVPRLGYVGFSIAQPYLVNSMITYITYHSQLPNNYGYGLLGAYAICYTGLAVGISNSRILTASRNANLLPVLAANVDAGGIPGYDKDQRSPDYDNLPENAHHSSRDGQFVSSRIPDGY